MGISSLQIPISQLYRYQYSLTDFFYQGQNLTEMIFYLDQLVHLIDSTYEDDRVKPNKITDYRIRTFLLSSLKILEEKNNEYNLIELQQPIIKLKTCIFKIYQKL